MCEVSSKKQALFFKVQSSFKRGHNTYAQVGCFGRGKQLVKMYEPVNFGAFKTVEPNLVLSLSGLEEQFPRHLEKQKTCIIGKYLNKREGVLCICEHMKNLRSIN
jgi:hypothetical protein